MFGRYRLIGVIGEGSMGTVYRARDTMIDREGEVTADIEARPTASGLAVNARLQLSGVDGNALRNVIDGLPAWRV